MKTRASCACARADLYQLCFFIQAHLEEVEVAGSDSTDVRSDGCAESMESDTAEVLDEGVALPSIHVCTGVPHAPKLWRIWPQTATSMESRHEQSIL